MGQQQLTPQQQLLAQQQLQLLNQQLTQVQQQQQKKGIMKDHPQLNKTDKLEPIQSQEPWLCSLYQPHLNSSYGEVLGVGSYTEVLMGGGSGSSPDETRNRLQVKKAVNGGGSKTKSPLASGDNTVAGVQEDGTI